MLRFVQKNLGNRVAAAGKLAADLYVRALLFICLSHSRLSRSWQGNQFAIHKINYLHFYEVLDLVIIYGFATESSVCQLVGSVSRSLVLDLRNKSIGSQTVACPGWYSYSFSVVVQIFFGCFVTI